MKNTLVTVQSIATQTLRNAPTTGDAKNLYNLNQYDKAREKFAELDKRQSTRDTQYGLYYSGAKLDPLHRGD